MELFIFISSLFLLGIFIGSVFTFSIPIVLGLRKNFGKRFHYSSVILPLLIGLFLIVSSIAIFASLKENFWSDKVFDRSIGWFFTVGFLTPVLLFGIDSKRFDKKD
jgi:uncharacterized membrane protein YkvI